MFYRQNWKGKIICFSFISKHLKIGMKYIFWTNENWLILMYMRKLLCEHSSINILIEQPSHLFHRDSNSINVKKNILSNRIDPLPFEKNEIFCNRHRYQKSILTNTFPHHPRQASIANIFFDVRLRAFKMIWFRLCKIYFPQQNKSRMKAFLNYAKICM